MAFVDTHIWIMSTEKTLTQRCVDVLTGRTSVTVSDEVSFNLIHIRHHWTYCLSDDARGVSD